MGSQKKKKKTTTTTNSKSVTLLGESQKDERHPEMDPQTPHGAVRKLREETAEGHGVLGKAKRALEEADRQIAGEYERREQPD